MLQMTTDATKHLRAAGERRDVGERTPRFAQKAGQVRLGFASSPAPDDTVVEVSGMRVFVAKDIVDRLDGALIDVREDDGKRVLILRRQDDQAGPRYDA